MLFDDRLATVLRSAMRSETGARTQFRQLVDLLGSMPDDAGSELADAAYARLGELAGALPAAVQSAILREPGLRLRSRRLVAWLAEGEPQAAAAAMATARLTESDWLYLIPRLPMTARGFLRHRRNMPESAQHVLERLGVQDLVLPQPEAGAIFDIPASAEEALQPAEPAPPSAPQAEEKAEISALLRRIEAFQQARRNNREAALAPQLPLEDAREADHRRHAVDFATDAEGTIQWADPSMAPVLIGLVVGPPRPGAVAELDPASLRAIARHGPIRGGKVAMLGLPEIAGDWRIDAAPIFTPGTGSFAGYRGRLCRIEASPQPAAAPADDAVDRMRQLLHELRTPVNAIQGFAEIIQQQMFGPAPNEYRALAAGVAVDAARLLAGFEEIDRLARLESDAFELTPGESDLRDSIKQTLRRLEAVLRPRSARIEFEASGKTFTIGLPEAESLQLVWRLLATLAGALAPAEIIALTLGNEEGTVTLHAELPAALADNADLFAAGATAQPRAVTAGMFGAGFTFRLARAEAIAMGGSLLRQGDALILTLPALTGPAANHSVDPTGTGGQAAGG